MNSAKRMFFIGIIAAVAVVSAGLVCWCQPSGSADGDPPAIEIKGADGEKYITLDGVDFDITLSGKDVTIKGLHCANPGASPVTDPNAECTIPNKFSYDGETYDIVSIGFFNYRSSFIVKKLTIEDLELSVNCSFAGSKIESLVLNNVRMNGMSVLGNANLKELSIDNLSVGDYMFANVSCFANNAELASVSVSNCDIGLNAFGNCASKVDDPTSTGLKNVTLNNVGKIGARAFEGCRLLENIDLNGVKEIEEGAFGGCKALKSLTIPSSMEAMSLMYEGKSYMDSGMTITNNSAHITIEDGIASYVKDGMRYIAGVNSASVAENISYTDPVSIGDCMFKGNTRVKTLSFTGKALIGTSAFEGCVLTSVKIEGDNSELGEYAFKDTAITKLDIAGAVSIGTGCFQSAVIGNGITLPQGLKYLGSNSIGVQNGIKSVKLLHLEYLGNAFASWTDLETVEISGQLKTKAPYGYTPSVRAFAGCTSLTKITLTDATEIPESCFEGCSALKKACALNVATVAKNAFALCGNLTTFEGKPVNIGEGAFKFTGLSGFTFDVTKKTDVGKWAFWFSGLEDADIVVKGAIGIEAFSNSGIASIKVITPSTIAEKAFFNCISLKSADLSGATKVEKNAFAGCNYLGTVSFTENSAANLKTVGVRAFDGCIALGSVAFPKTLSSLSIDAFVGCTSLTSFSVVSGGTFSSYSGCVYNGNALYMCPAGLSSLELGAGKTIQGIGTANNVLRYSDSLRAINVASGNTSYSSLDGYVLSNDGTALLYIPCMRQIAEIPASVKSVGAYALCFGSTTRISATSDITFKTGSLASGYTLDFKGVDGSLAEVSVDCNGTVVFEQGSIVASPYPSVHVKAQTFRTTPGNIPARVTDLSVDSVVAELGSGIMTDSGSVVIRSDRIVLSANGLPAGYLRANGTSISYGAAVQLFGAVEISGGLTGGYFTVYLSQPNQVLMDALPNSRVYAVGHAFDGGNVAGHFIVRDGAAVMPLYSEAGKDFFLVTGAGLDAVTTRSGDMVSIAVSSAMGYIASDIAVTVNGTEIQPAEGMRYEVPFESDAAVDISVRKGGQPVLVEFDPCDGSAKASVLVDSGMSILPGQFPSLSMEGHKLVGWYADREYLTPYERAPVTADTVIYAKWAKSGPSVRVSGPGMFMAGGAAYSGSEFTGPITISFEPRSGYRFISWDIVGTCVCTPDGSSITIAEASSDIALRALSSYVSLSLEVTNPLATDMQTTGTLIPTWEFGSTNISMSGMSWSGMPSIPLIVDDRVYVRAGGVLYALDVRDGSVLHSVESSNKVSYYHTIAYAGGMIIDDIMGKVYDMDLNYQYDLPAKSACIIEHGGFIYLFGDKIMKFSIPADKDFEMIDGVKTKINLQTALIEGISPYGAWGQTVAPKFIGDFVYTVQAHVVPSDPDYGRIFVNAANLSTGEKNRIELELYKNKFIDDTCFSCYGGKLYVTTYTKGIFSDAKDVKETWTSVAQIDADGTNMTVAGYTPVYVAEYALNNNKPAGSTGYASQFVVSGGNGFMGAGGALTVFDFVDGKPVMKFFRDGAAWLVGYTGHGGITVDDRRVDGVGSVFVFKVPYKPVEVLDVYEVVFHRDGTMSGVYRQLPCPSVGNYGSQAVRAGPNGEIIWYNDDGLIHCFASLDKEPLRFLVKHGDSAYVISGSGSLKEVLRGDSLVRFNQANGTVMHDGKPMNIFAMSSDGIWEKVYDLNNYCKRTITDSGLAIYYTRVFTLTDEDSVPDLGTGGAGWYGIAGGRAVRLDMEDAASASALSMAQLTWYGSEPQGIVVQAKASLVAGADASFGASSSAGDISWSVKDGSVASLTVSDDGRIVNVRGLSAGETVIYGASGAYRATVAVSVLPAGAVVNDDGSTSVTAVSEKQDGDALVRTTATTSTSADGSVVTKTVRAERIVGNKTVRTDTSVSTETSSSEGIKSKTVTVTVSESADADGKITAHSERTETAETWSDADGYLVGKTDSNSDDGLELTESHEQSKKRAGRTDSEGSETVTDKSGSMIRRTSWQSIRTPDASAVKTVSASGGADIAATVASGDIQTALAFAAGLGGPITMIVGGSVSAADMRAIADAGAYAEFSAAGVAMRLSPANLREAAAKGDAAITASSAAVPPAASKLRGCASYSLSLTIGGEPMVFSSDVEVVIPYAGAANRVSAYSVGADGKLSALHATASSGSATVTMRQLSPMVAGEAPAPVSPPASEPQPQPHPNAPVVVAPSADGTVSQGQIDAALSTIAENRRADPSAAPVVSIEAPASGAALPASGLAAMAAAGATLKVEAPSGTVELPPAVLQRVSAAGGDVRIGVSVVDPSKLVAEHRERASGGIVVDVTAYAGASPIHALGGKAKVVVPIAIEPGRTAADLRVWYITDGGAMEEVQCEYDAALGAAVFYTDHFSRFAVGFVSNPADQSEPLDRFALWIAAIAVIAIALCAAGAWYAVRRRAGA